MSDPSGLVSPVPVRSGPRAATKMTKILAALTLFATFLSVGALFSDSADGAIWLGFLAVVSGVVGLGAAIVSAFTDREHRWTIAGSVIGIIFGGIVAVGTVMVSALAGIGGAWGRPLRVSGRVRHPKLREGSDWTAGARPDPAGLDADTRRALAELWLHDAKKEHASVPAFARVSWLLASVGAPPELMIGAHEAALQEIDHAQRCFALAAGYGGAEYTVDAMPELAGGVAGGVDDPLRALAVESLKDGCLLEDFNADVAELCARVCEEPVTRAVLEQIAVEERAHAELSWSILAWALERGSPALREQVRAELTSLERYRRPTAVAWYNRPLVRKADEAAMRRHGRVSDDEWRERFAARVLATRARAQGLLDRAGATSPAAADAGLQLTA